MDKRLFKLLMNSVKEINAESFPDYSDIKVRFHSKKSGTKFLVPNKNEYGEIKSYTVKNKEDLINIGINEDYLCKLEENYNRIQKYKIMKNKLFKISGKKRLDFTKKENLNIKYSDALTIVDSLRTHDKLITMYDLLRAKESYLSELYFDFKKIMKLRACALNKKNNVSRIVYKNDKPIKKVFLNKNELSKIKRIELCKYEKENK